MLSLTRHLYFYKNDVRKGFTNPMRRWFYHYLFAGVTAGSFLYVWGQYRLAAREAMHFPERGDRLCSNGFLELMFMLPLNALSYAGGCLSESRHLPTWAHHAMIDALVWWHRIDLSDTDGTASFDTLQDFFVRPWRDGARPVRAAAVTSPVDGLLLAVADGVEGERLVQVKGVMYSVRDLLRGELGPVAKGHKRVAFVLRLRTGDYHHVISPCSFACQQVVYVPGALLPNSAAGFHWIPSVMTLNERVILRGRMATGEKDGISKTKNISNDANSGNKAAIAMVLVGGTLTGRIALQFDSRIKTNYLSPLEYAVHRRYESQPVFSKGTPLATFQWGSAVVLLVDVPNEAPIGVRAGDLVKAGEPLIT